MADDAAKDDSTTLAQLCADLGPDLIEIAIAPRGTEVPISRVILHDPLGRLAYDRAANGLLLAVGASPGDETLGSLVRSAATAGISAIACRGAAGLPRQLVDTAEGAGVALLIVSDEIEWGELFELASAALIVDFDRGDRPVSAERPALHDLSAIAEALAAITGGSVTIDDMRSRVLAFSGGDAIDEMRTTSILHRRAPERWLRTMRQHKVTEQLLKSDDVIQIDLDESQPRRVIAIRLGKSILGSIWLAGDEQTLSPGADDALRRAAPIAALQLMRQRVAVDVDRRMREAALATLLRGGEAPASALRRIGLDADEHFVVVVLEVTAHSASSPPVVGPRLIDLLMMYFHGYDHPAAATSLEEARVRRGSQRERIYVLTSAHGDADRIVLLEKASECIKHAARMLGVELRAGIGSEVEGPEALTLARRSAEDCLAFAPPSAQVIRYEDVQDQALLSEVERLVAEWHASPSTAFRNLVAHDKEHGTEYVATLSCILDAFGSTSRIAEQLHIHVNTVRYRIRRIAEITGVELGDCDARLALELTLRAFSKSS